MIEEAMTWRWRWSTDDHDTISTEDGMKMEENEEEDTENTTAEVESWEERGRRGKRRSRGGIAMETMGMETEGRIGNEVDRTGRESESALFMCVVKVKICVCWKLAEYVRFAFSS